MKEDQIRIPFSSLFFVFGSQAHATSGTKTFMGHTSSTASPTGKGRLLSVLHHPCAQWISMAFLPGQAHIPLD